MGGSDGQGDGLLHRASTRPGPEAGMGDRTQWHSVVFWELQRGPARRPGWAQAPHGDGPRGRRGGASTRPGPEAGMGASEPPATTRAPGVLQRGPARRPGWALQEHGR